jgi:TonB family protein
MKVSSFVALLVVVVTGGFALTANPETDAAEYRKVITRVMPTYPTIARNLNLTGSVKLEAVVAPDGSVKSVQVLGGNPVFAQPAEDAIHSWKWEKSEHETTERVEVRFNP